MTGGQSTKKGRNDAPAPLPLHANARYMADLTSYEDACRTDPDLQAFDHTLHERTNLVIKSLALGVEGWSLSLESLRELIGGLREMNLEMVKVILECDKDIWKNKKIFALVEEYFENSQWMLIFCNALEECLLRARDSQGIIQYAIQQFEGEGTEGNKCAKVLENLQKFRAAGNPFTEEFFMIFQSVYEQQEAMLEKLQIQKKKLDKKLKSTKTWMRVSNIFFVTTFVSALIFSVMAAAVAAPPAVIALAEALAIPIGPVGKWCNSLWKNYQSALKRQRELISSMRAEAYTTIKDMDSVEVLVRKLELEIKSEMRNVNFARSEDGAVKFVIGELKKRLEIVTKTVTDLGEDAESCSQEIRKAKRDVLKRMNNFAHEI